MFREILDLQFDTFQYSQFTSHSNPILKEKIFNMYLIPFFPETLQKSSQFSHSPFHHIEIEKLIFYISGKVLFQGEPT